MSPSMQCDLDAVEALLYAYHEGWLNIPDDKAELENYTGWMYNETFYKVNLNRGFCHYIVDNCSVLLEFAFDAWVVSKGLHPVYPFDGVEVFFNTPNKWGDHESGRTRIAYIEEFVQHYFGKYL